MKNILLTNDDGFDALGIKALYSALKEHFKDANITIIAPHLQKSACSHSLSLHHPLRLKEHESGIYSLHDGTPADCVYVGLSKLFSGDLDLVISGINHGANLGEDISYSGTCAGAMEAVLHGVPAIASSLYYENGSIEKYGFSLACELVCKLAARILEFPPNLAPRQFLNLNVPACAKADFKGLKVAKTGKRSYGSELDIRIDPRGGEYIWLGEPDVVATEQRDECDITLITQNYATLSPIKVDMCATASLDELSSWAGGMKWAK